MNSLLGKKTKDISYNFVTDNVTVEDPELIAEEFNKFFIQHPLNIQNNIPQSNSNYFHLIPQQNITVKYENSSAQEVLDIIKFSLKKNSNIHDIPTKFLKLCADRYIH